MSVTPAPSIARRARTTARGPAARRPVGRRDPQQSGIARAPRARTHRDDAAEEADPVLERAAVVVVALVAERREELVQQVAVRAVDLEQPKPASSARLRRGARTRRRPRRSRARQRARRRVPSSNGDRARRERGASRRLGRAAVPFHGAGARLAAGVRELHRRDRALRGTNRAMRASVGLRVEPDPVSSGEMRPRASTAVASAMTSAAPPTARLPRCTRCHVVGNPSTREYWHIGETTIRFRSVNPPRTKGSNRCMPLRCPSLPRGCKPRGQRRTPAPKTPPTSDPPTESTLPLAAR